MEQSIAHQVSDIASRKKPLGAWQLPDPNERPRSTCVNLKQDYSDLRDDTTPFRLKYIRLRSADANGF